MSEILYRPNVAALMINHKGQLLVCERNNVPNSWQFPQGGVDPGESHLDALYREMNEEIGLLPRHYVILKQRAGYQYLYPEEVRVKKIRKHGFHGQEQTYFLCLVRSDAPKINIDQKPREFSAFKWIEFSEFRMDWVPSFKQLVYRDVLADFLDLSV